jgi:hypothetical protein
MLWPMNVATKAPAIPSTIVTKKPGGIVRARKQKPGDEARNKADYRDPDDARHDNLSNSAQAN